MLPRRTFPDDGYTVSQYPAPDIDITELAARLSSPVIYRRSGKVIYSDNFLTTLGWVVTGSLNFTCDIITPGAVTTAPVVGSSFMRMIASKNSPFNVVITRFMPILATRRIGIELSYAGLFGLDAYLMLSINEILVPTGKLGRIRVDFVNGVVQLYNSAGTWTDKINIQGTAGSEFYWGNIKFVCDFDTNTYAYLSHNENELYLNEGLYDQGTILVGRSIYFEVQLIGNASLDTTVYIDDAVITMDEP